MIRTWCATLLAVACLTTQVATQQPTQRQLDSLAAQVRQLRAKVDSLLAAQGRKPSAPAPVGDDLAALRAAASQAAGGGGRDTTQTSCSSRITPSVPARAAVSSISHDVLLITAWT